MANLGPSEEEINPIISFLSTGKFNEALERVTTLSQKYPSELLLINISGICYQGLGKLETAVEYYRKAIKIDSGYYKAHFNLGGAYQALGMQNDAIKSYKSTLSIRPDYVEAHNNIGSLYKELNQFDNAIESFRKAIKINPDYFEAHYNLGIVFQDLNNLEEAIKNFHRVLVIKPDFAELHNNLGIIYKEIDEIDSALEHFKNAVRIKPEFAEAHNNLGIINNDLGQFNEALKIYETAIAINPNYAEAHFNFGNSLSEVGQTDKAVKSFKKALLINPDYADAYLNLGNNLQDLGQLDEAIEYYQNNLLIDQDNAQVHYELGTTFMKLGEITKSIESFQRAIKIKPDYDEAHNGLGIMFHKIGKYEKALRSYEIAYSINPKYAEVYFNLGNLLVEINQLDHAIVNYEHAYNLKPGIDYNFGNLFHNKMHLCIWDNFYKDLDELIIKLNQNGRDIDPYSLSTLIDDAKIQLKNAVIHSDYRFQNRHALTKVNHFTHHTKIRIGYFSADFREHPVSALSAEIYELHDRSQFEIYAFSFGPDTKDKLNLRIKAGVDNFYDVSTMSYKDIAMLSRSLEIDIAIDLGGHTHNNKMEIFDISAAPIQINYLGYPGTTGASFYDYILADNTIIPENQKNNYSENIIFMPNCYMPQNNHMHVSEKLLTRQEFNLPEDGFVFCCFNNHFKITPKEFDIWMRLLRKIDGSVLWLLKANEWSEINLKAEAKKRGIQGNRLIFADKIKVEEHLARQKLADLFLDTFNFNAHTTASDALRVGLPIVTKIGKGFAARVTSSLLNSLKTPELITKSEKEYEALALSLANNVEKLTSIKKKLADNHISAPLFDTVSYTKHLEKAYTKAYECFKKELPPKDIKLL